MGLRGLELGCKNTEPGFNFIAKAYMALAGPNEIYEITSRMSAESFPL